MRRVSVVGNSGSGKSTLGRALAATLNVPYVELDSIFHQPNWTPLPEEAFRATVSAIVDRDGWVVDGNSLLRVSVQRGTPRVRALLLDPDCEAARRRAVEIGEEFESFTSGIRLVIARPRELNEHTGTVCCYLYKMLPTWRMVCLDGTMFVSAFGETHEGHTSPMYQLTPRRAVPGFRRFAKELLKTARQVVGGHSGD